MFSLLLFTFGTVYVSKKVEGIDPGVIPSKVSGGRNFNNWIFIYTLIINKNIDNFGWLELVIMYNKKFWLLLRF